MRELGAEIIVVDQSAIHDQLVAAVDSAVRTRIFSSHFVSF